MGQTGRRWEDNIKMNLGDIGIDGANWIRLGQDRVQGTVAGFCEHGDEPSGSVRKRNIF
jgi:hypothetical protein